MKTLIIILISTIFMSCQKQEVPELNSYAYESSPELEAIIQKFEKIYKTKINFTITFVNDSDINPSKGGVSFAGQCQRIEGGGVDKRQVVINKDWWNQQTDYPQFKELVVFHELGHCYFLREHDDTMLENGYPRSIMKSSVNQFLYVYSWFYEYYLTELNAGADLTVLNPENPTEFSSQKIIINSFNANGECGHSH